MSSSPADGSEDVNDFLQRIKELGDRRDQEDEERNRKLEEEILQGRKERQARRAERARSISPTKSSPANTPTTTRQLAIKPNSLSQAQSPIIEPHKDPDPRRDTTLDAMDPPSGSSISPAKDNYSPDVDSERDFADPSLKRVSSIKASPSNAMPSRNSPLSWQRRPNSQSSDRPRSRPLSMVATENAARSPRDTPEPSTANDPEPSLTRNQIAQSLASKDPAWFRQSADSRGGISLAYRKNQVEDEDRSDHGSKSTRVPMPGMSHESPKPDQITEDPINRASSPSRSRTGLGVGAKNSGIGSPVPLTSLQRFDPPNQDAVSETRGLAMSPSQGRISTERMDRPVSPTKGMGGFVQSAMMKRSDSVSKRWSVQSPPGLNRGNSIASNRSIVDPSTPLALGNIVNSSGGGSRQSSPSRDGSPRPLSRPTSSQSNATITQDGRPGTGSSMRNSITTSTNNDVFIKSSLPASRSQTPQDIKTGQENSRKDADSRTETTPPTSPSKTMDSKRWSPTKSSWLESALNKPESPKPKHLPPTQQPAWMSEINKTKQKASIDLGRGPTNTPKHEVSIGGLMRSPPPGGLAKPISIGGLPAGFSSGASTKGRSESISSQQSRPSISKEEISATTISTPTTTVKPSPTNTKVKPETPPKKDFRANLKPRQNLVDSGKEEPEFKNVFGQLRRTKTQNYVAPDELKNNITRGKAALNVTGGPKKTERKDEFKDAILKKKEDFKQAQLEGKGVTRSTSNGSHDSPLPEALAKRKVLGRSDSSAGAKSDSTDSPSTGPSFREPPKYSLSSKENNVPAPGRLQGKETAGGKLAGRFNPALAGLLARGPPSMASDTSRSSSPASSQRTVSMSTSTTVADGSEPGPQLTHMTKGRARGPRRKAPSTAPVAETSVAHNVVRNSMQEEPPQSKQQDPTVPSTTESPQRTVMKLSLAKEESRLPSPKLSSLEMPRSVVSTQDISSQIDSETLISQPSSPRKLDLKRRSQFLQEVSNKDNNGKPELDTPRPLSPTKNANPIDISLRAGESVPDAKPLPTAKAKPITPLKPTSVASNAYESSSVAVSVDSLETSKVRPTPLSPKKTINESTLPLHNFSAVHTKSTTASTDSHSNKNLSSEGQDPENPVSVRDVASRWDRPTPTQSSSPPRKRSPIKLPTRDDEKAAMIGAGLRSASPEKQQVPESLGLQTTKYTNDSTSSRPLPTPPSKGLNSPAPSTGFMPSVSPTKSNSPPMPQSSEASRLVADFFGQHSSPPDFVADTAAILAARPDERSNIKTLRSNLYRFSGDGKKQLVPTHQERLLFEGNMYICIHIFGNEAGKKITQVYHWIGDSVPETTFAGADIFAQREARGAGGTLVKIQQGKETPEFFQALGGIIIIRRGSSNKYDSLAPHILCGRKHCGQIAFDEVDYSASSLCSGFPYLISTQSGKSYLWKGKGSGIDELSCARLIGMDFGLTGEIEEVEDGSEPPSFLQIFGNGTKIPKSADHWRSKPNYSKYCSRLFCADSAAKSQIVEIFPFNQSDVSPFNVSILDAFFEIYIIVGSRAQSQYAAFHNSLMFAQEYGILAAGMEDRPYVPVSTVVLEGIPKDMKSVFRKWSDGLTPTVMQPASPGLQRGRSLRLVPLTAALEATR